MIKKVYLFIILLFINTFVFADVTFSPSVFTHNGSVISGTETYINYRSFGGGTEITTDWGKVEGGVKYLNLQSNRKEFDVNLTDVSFYTGYEKGPLSLKADYHLLDLPGETRLLKSIPYFTMNDGKGYYVTTTDTFELAPSYKAGFYGFYGTLDYDTGRFYYYQYKKNTEYSIKLKLDDFESYGEMFIFPCPFGFNVCPLFFSVDFNINNNSDYTGGSGKFDFTGLLLHQTLNLPFGKSSSLSFFVMDGNLSFDVQGNINARFLEDTYLQVRTDFSGEGSLSVTGGGVSFDYKGRHFGLDLDYAYFFSRSFKYDTYYEYYTWTFLFGELFDSSGTYELPDLSDFYIWMCDIKMSWAFDSVYHTAPVFKVSKLITDYNFITQAATKSSDTVSSRASAVEKKIDRYIKQGRIGDLFKNFLLSGVSFSVEIKLD